MEKKQSLKLSMSRFKLAEHCRNVWIAMPPAGEDYSLLLESDYWAHNAKTIRPGDRIEVIPEDMAYYAELIVISSGNTHAKVKELRKFSLQTESAIEENVNGIRVKFNGPHDRYTVFRGKDKVQTGFQSLEEANAAAALIIKEA